LILNGASRQSKQRLAFLTALYLELKLRSCDTQATAVNWKEYPVLNALQKSVLISEHFFYLFKKCMAGKFPIFSCGFPESHTYFPEISGKFRQIFPEISQLTTLPATSRAIAAAVDDRHFSPLFLKWSHFYIRKRNNVIAQS